LTGPVGKSLSQEKRKVNVIRDRQDDGVEGLGALSQRNIATFTELITLSASMRHEGRGLDCNTDYSWSRERGLKIKAIREFEEYLRLNPLDRKIRKLLEGMIKEDGRL
jgi:aspartate oxidase